MTNLLVTVRFSPEEIETLIGAASKLYDYERKELERILLDNIAQDMMTGEAKTRLFTALIGVGIVLRERFIEIILQIDKEKLTPDSALLLAEIKGKHKIEETES